MKNFTEPKALEVHSLSTLRSREEAKGIGIHRTLWARLFRQSSESLTKCRKRKYPTKTLQKYEFSHLFVYFL